MTGDLACVLRNLPTERLFPDVDRTQPFPLHSFDMPPLTADSQAPPKNGRPPILDEGGNDHSNALDVVEEFQGPGFRFVRAFLLVILLLVGILLALAGFLSWYFSMDVTVEGKGVIEPRQKHLVKTEISGIIKEIHVRSGQNVCQVYQISS